MPARLFFAALLTCFAGLAEARGRAPTPDLLDHVLKGRVEVLEAHPHNPAGKNRLFTRLQARVDRDAQGQPVVVLRHVASGETCRFPAWKSPRGKYLLDGAPPCTFRALGSRGTLRIVEGSLWEAGGRVTLEAVIQLKWLHYRGVVQVDARGGAAVVRAR